MSFAGDYIFDIDGTVLDISHRLKFIVGDGAYKAGKGTPGQKDWKAFRDPKQKRWDEPIGPMLGIMNSLLNSGAKVVVSTGRQRAEEEDTRLSLKRHIDKLDSVKFYMRSNRDRRDDYIVKSDHLDMMRADGYNPVMVFEDRPTVIAMWRLKGLLVADVSDPEKGDF